jgi:putative Ca2+/H+ antiporter (TMEM165/GDT1 family)
MSSKTREHLQLLLGILLAFLVVDGFAVLFGSRITNVILFKLLKIATGMIFIAFGAMKLGVNGTTSRREPSSRNTFLSGFGLIFLTEWGDKTQIAAALLATKYNAIMVLAGTMGALILLSAIAIYLGKFISNRVKSKTLTRAAGVVFILMGASFFLF